MFNQANPVQPSKNLNEKIYIKQIDGTTYEAIYDGKSILYEFICGIYVTHVLENIQIISKGRLLQLHKSLHQNQILPNQLIHILKNQKPHKIISISFNNKLYKIQYTDNDKISQFKKTIQKYINVPIHRQIIFYKQCFLDDQKYIKEYQINQQDIAYVGEVQDNCRKNNGQINQRIINNMLYVKKRRGSDGQNNISSQNNINNHVNKLACSQINLNSNSTIGHTQSSYNNLQLQQSSLSSSQQDQIQENKKQNVCQFNKINQQQITQSQTQQQLINNQQSKVIEQYSQQQINQSLLNKLFQNNKTIQQQNITTSQLILQSKYNQQIGALQFKMDSSMQYFNKLKLQTSESKVFTQGNSSQFNIEAVFNELMVTGKQQVVFCQSFCQKQSQIQMNKFEETPVKKFLRQSAQSVQLQQIPQFCQTNQCNNLQNKIKQNNQDNIQSK